MSAAFNAIKTSFEETQEFSGFFTEFSEALKGAVKGFVHSLAVDFSAYDPNNYAKSLRIYAKEGDSVRGFEEFGTGEQQVLLMAFVKAYMQVFAAEDFILIIEEPEAHLHPLAQKWLKEYIVEMCSSGIQVVISTHPTDFIDAEYLDGLVRVFKEGGMVLRPKAVVDPRFFPFFIASDYFLDAAIKISVGSLSSTINWRNLAQLEFELPDLMTQAKLADIMEALTRTKHAYERLISISESPGVSALI